MKRKLTPKQKVLREFLGAWFNREERIIEGYSQGLILGRGAVTARNIEQSAWADAARRLGR